MEVIAWIVAGIAVAMVLGQFFAGTADYYLSIENPRPLDEHVHSIRIFGWGFASEQSRTIEAIHVGQGLADVRLYATRKQMLVSLLTFGAVRPVTVAWRGNAGIHPLGDA